jgi:RecB family exonuclease
MTFLEETAKNISDRHGTELSAVAVVFQNRRAALYFKHHLADLAGGASWLPWTTSIQDFWSERTGLRRMETVELFFTAFESYRESGGLDTIGDFSRWAPTALSDFDEIDHYFVDHEKFFRAARDLKRVEAWSPDGKTTPMQGRYLDHLERMEIFYKRLTARMQSARAGYDGWIARTAVTVLDSLTTGMPYRYVYFVGFNALTRCEEKLMKALCDRERGEIIVDADEYYTDDPMQEAGSGLRLMARTMGWKKIPGVGQHYRNSSKQITLTAAARRVGQARTAGHILSEIPSEHHSKTAVVLADETALLPVLHAIPDTVASLNVSMGYPCGMTSSADLVRLLLEMQERSLEWDPRGFYHKDIERLLHHPFLRRVNAALCRDLLDQMAKWNQVIFSEADWKEAVNDQPEFARWIALWKDGADALTGLKSVMEEWIERSFSLLEKEAARHLYRIVALIERYSENLSGPLSLRVVREMLMRLIAETRIPFIGEPLEGLQVLGFLETRSLDFKNVIVVSANEGTLPRPSRRESSIPFELRKEWGLPTHELHDGIYAYNFYRLLQRAENVWIVYDSETDELGQGERSRFIAQMLRELPSYHSGIRIRDEVARFPFVLHGPSTTDRVMKDGNVLDLLREYLQSGVSPTALQSYYECRMRFYYQYLLGLKAGDDVEESIDAMTFGTIIHESLNELYAEFEGSRLVSDRVRQKKESIPDVIVQAARKVFGRGELRFGKNYLMMQVATKWLERFMAWDSERAGRHRVFLEGLEMAADRRLAVHGYDVRFYGRLDRVETVDDQPVVIDFKTGKAEESKKSDMDAVMKDKRALQLAFYAWLRSEASSDVPQPAIFSFRHFSDPLMALTVDGHQLTTAHVDEFEQHLITWIAEVTDPNLPFERTGEINRCQYCDFQVICQRQSRESLF